MISRETREWKDSRFGEKGGFAWLVIGALIGFSYFVYLGLYFFSMVIFEEIWLIKVLIFLFLLFSFYYFYCSLYFLYYVFFMAKKINKKERGYFVEKFFFGGPEFKKEDVVGIEHKDCHLCKFLERSPLDFRYGYFEIKLRRRRKFLVADPGIFDFIEELDSDSGTN